MAFTTDDFKKIITKPWGREIIFTPPSLDRTGKLIYIDAGKRLSLQYHEQKEETLCLVSGQALLWIENSDGEIMKVPMATGAGYTVMPGQKHRLEAVTGCLIAEVSSPETGTTVRLEDDFARPDETEAMRARQRQ